MIERDNPLTRRTPSALLSVITLAAIPALAEPPASEPTGTPPAEKPAADQPPADDPVLKILVLPTEEVRRRPVDDIKVLRMGWAKGINYLVPFRFIPEKPANAMRLAQMRILPNQDNPAMNGQLVISGGIGGSVEDNVARWVSQFRDLEGVPTQQDLVIAGTDLIATQVIVTGTYNAAMPGSPPEWQPDQTLLGAIVQGGPDGLLFIKAVGPKQTMAERRDTWDMFIRTLRVAPHPDDIKPRGGDNPPHKPTRPAPK